MNMQEANEMLMKLAECEKEKENLAGMLTETDPNNIPISIRAEILSGIHESILTFEEYEKYRIKMINSIKKVIEIDERIIPAMKKAILFDAMAKENGVER